MRHPRYTVGAVGAAVALLYLAGAGWSGHLSPFARRPLDDGIGPPPAYRWVKPPAALAASNQPALSGIASITFANGKSQAGVFRTDDSQIVVVILGGAIPEKPGQSVALTIDPLAPDGFGPPPAGLQIAGNVYRVHGAFEPSGEVVTSLDVGMEVVQVYPTPARPSVRHTLLVSTDKHTWQRLPTVDSAIQHQVQSEHVGTLGYFAVSEAAGSGTAAPPAGGGSILLPIVVAVALLALLVVVFLEVRRRRAREATAHRRKR
jgi:hypothetical protein